jgi:HlyD family secretion protein
VDSYPSRDFPGIVESVAPKATIVSGVVNYEVTINIRKDAHLLKPDMTANVSIQTAQHMALLLPAAAVQRDGDQSFVYVQGKDGTYRRPVVIGSKETGMVEIKRGISSDENVLLVSASGTEPVRSSQSVP